MVDLKRHKDTIFTAISDQLMVFLAMVLFLSLHPQLQAVFENEYGWSSLVVSLLHAAFWLPLFVFAGLYKRLYLISRFDEFVKVIKAVTLGVLILYFTVTASGLVMERGVGLMALHYFALMGGWMSLNRFVIRTIQRMYAKRGKGLHRAIIIGTGKTAFNIYEDLLRNRTLGMQVLGFVRVPNGKHHPDEVPEDEIIGNVEDVDRLVTQMGIQDVIVAVDPDKRADLVRVFQQVNHPDVGIKLLPDFHQLVIGLNKTNQIFGLPLIEISPDVMPLWEKITKRTLDIVFSLFGLIVTAPLLLILMVWIRKDSKGGALFKQVRVGRYGEPFTIYKLRTMVVDAEQETGPTWATENDPRVTGVGRILRKLRLDEIPQLYNVLKGEMSLVGPRPERPFFVEQFNKEIPMYFRRLRVRPGITGWAQVKWKYDTTLDDVFEKTKYDLFYVENMSLILDFKILFNTLFSVIRAKGQ